MKGLFIFLFFVFISTIGYGKVKHITNTKQSSQTVQIVTHLADSTISTDTVRHRKHKFIAAILAFPLGLIGLHRIYLGTSTGVPFLYLATFGGCFGVLPFVDFVLILLCKDVNTYAHNPGIFMWSRKK